MNVLKNYAKKAKRYLLLASLSLTANDAFCFSENKIETAQEVTGRVNTSATDLVSMLMALLFVLFVIFIIAWFAKKLNLTPTSSDHFKLINSMSLGGRERIVIIEVQGEQHAIGVTNQSVNHLFKLSDNIEQQGAKLANSDLVTKINKLFGYQAPKQSASGSANSQVKDSK